ncbi:MAG: hypothetical protein HYT97_08675 [Elusimicrobia bacterium]|nr:hypothetical protein [Elusimicrobiota bacterium]
MTQRTQTILQEIASLTEEEREELLSYLEHEEDMGWSQLSEKSFADDWLSSEDSIYDRFQTR